MLLDNILSGLGRATGGSRASSTTEPYIGVNNVNTNAAHQSGSYSSSGTKTYSNSDGESYTIDKSGNVTYSIDTPGGKKTNLTAAQYDAYRAAVQQYNAAYQLAYANNLDAPSWNEFERGNGANVISRLHNEISAKENAVSVSASESNNSDNENIWLWLLLPFGIMLVGSVFKKKNKKKKR